MLWRFSVIHMTSNVLLKNQHAIKILKSILYRSHFDKLSEMFPKLVCSWDRPVRFSKNDSYSDEIKFQPKVIHYRDYKNFQNDRYRDELTPKLPNIVSENNNIRLKEFLSICMDILDQYAACKQKYTRGNHMLFMNKTTGAITKLQLRDGWTFHTFRRNKNSPMPLSILYLAISVSIYQKVVKSKLPPRSGSSLEAVEPHP